MDILILNSGSSSLKYQFMNSVSGDVYGKGLIERIGLEGANIEHKKGERKVKIERDLPTHKEAVELLFEVLLDDDYGIIESIDQIQAIGHRIVHGASISKPTLVDDKVMQILEDATRFAPLHNPGAIQGILGVEEVAPGKPNVICVDTGFHSSIPDENAIYAIPYEYYEKDQIKRYGAHGTSHHYITLQLSELLNKPVEEVNAITCHLGNGASITAVKNGKSYDTSMGLTPLEGLVMGTRSGDLDPAVVFTLGKQYAYTYEEMDTLLNKKSGLLGVSGVSSDTRDVEEAAQNGNKAIISYILITEETTKIIVVISAIFMFVLLGMEHIVANFSSFNLIYFSKLLDTTKGFELFNILRHWGVSFIGNLIGGAMLGIIYAYLNSTKSIYKD